MQPVDVRDEYVEAHAQPVDASTLSSNQFRAHDLATQDLQQLQYLVAQMKDISVQVQEELHTAQEWQPRDYGYILEPDTQQKFKATYREVRKKEKILAKQEKQEKAAALPEARKLVDNNVNGLDMRVDLLSAEQERDLASMVQDLLQLEALAKELSTTLGRAPSDFEWMEAAGAAPQPDAGPEDVRAAVQLFQGRLQHGRAAKQLMISANYKLVVSICRKYSGYGLALGDLINEGVAGLVKGVERFEPSKGCKFSTYAHWWIRQGITRSLQEQGRLVRLPSHLQEMLTKMTKVSRAFEAQYGREPTLADLAAELNVEPAKIADAYEAVFTHRSLDQPMGDSEGATLGDVLEDERALGPDDAAYVDSLKHDLEGVLANLPAREAGVLRMRFGLVDGTEHTLDEIGLQFNVTRERIRQIEAKAIRQLRARQLQPGSVIADYQEGSMDSKVLASRTSSGTRKQS
ncbi:hypothetical protein OEZ85_012063 [Tetradesmus obliquus]|uniref:RNA polymerase sigma-70 domain-containing protein n=1 Tax=Tetradesmus obliquus TaxID=3088 RepID=A0ABY8TSK2_TETOB|nr:hypothetical protein OEZ85_012063 [Tetradesmus obliquus]